MQRKIPAFPWLITTTPDKTFQMTGAKKCRIYSVSYHFLLLLAHFFFFFFFFFLITEASSASFSRTSQGFTQSWLLYGRLKQPVVLNLGYSCRKSWWSRLHCFRRVCFSNLICSYLMRGYSLSTLATSTLKHCVTS